MTRSYPRSGRVPITLLGLALAAGSGCDGTPASTLPAGDAERGAEVVALAGGCGCHTMEGGEIGAGGREIETPFGTFYSTNITAHPAEGIGRWSDAEVAAAIRDGVLPDGSSEAPVMPYYRYAGMTDRDVADLVAYLRTLEPAARADREHDVALPLPRLAFRAWKAFLAPAARRPQEPPREPRARGRYLVDHVAICGDCHTPRDVLGVPREEMYLAGARDVLGQTAPNITPHQTGVASWDTDDMHAVLRHGMLPNLDNVQGLMAEVVDGLESGLGYADAQEASIDAIVAYLETVEPVEHRVDPEKGGSSE